MRERLVWLALSAGLLAVVWLTRPLLPVDETRYLSVAWEMWQRGDLLVPHLNGQPYSHKPPALFWLIHLGWWLGGVSEIWPRLVPAVAAFLSLLLTLRIAAQIWPGDERRAGLAGWLLLGMPLWSLMAAGTVMFDVPLVACVLLAVSGALQGWRRGGWLVAGAGLGLGILVKGPVVLLHTLPVLLLAPLWWPVAGRRQWYLGTGVAVLVGAAIGLSWAVPAALAGGPDYARAIFWGQSAERVVSSFAQREPFWWYLAFLPVLLLPWSAWLPVWSALRRLRIVDPGVRLLLAWILPVFLAFSVVSGKQAKYLLPLLPAVALLLADGLARLGPERRRVGAGPGVVLALGAAALPWLAASDRLAAWAPLTPAWLVPGLLGIAAGLLALRAPAQRGARPVAVAMVGMLALLHAGLAPVAAPYYDLHPVASHLAGLQASGTPIAHAGKYHGQYHFLGRLARPLEVIAPHEVRTWLDKHPDGRVVVYYRGQAPPGLTVEFRQHYRSEVVAVMRRSGG